MNRVVRFPILRLGTASYGFFGIAGDSLMWVREIWPSERELGLLQRSESRWTLTLISDVDDVSQRVRLALELAATGRDTEYSMRVSASS